MKPDEQSILQRVATLSNPHMKAINDAVSEAFPDNNPDQMYTIALTFELGVLLHALAETDRPHAVDTVNSVLAKEGPYRLMKLDS